MAVLELVASMATRRRPVGALMAASPEPSSLEGFLVLEASGACIFLGSHQGKEALEGIMTC